MGPIFRRIALATATLLCTLPTFAQDKAPQPIPRFEDELVPQIPPEVTYADGKLRIVARQATLADILDAIRTRSGAVVSAPPGIASEPISVKLGPATVLEVIRELLDTADCNYVVVGNAERPAGIRVAVFPKPSGEEPEVFESPAEANLKAPGNIPEEWNVTFTKLPDGAESNSSPREPLAATEAEHGTKQNAAPK
jgi:hypothetical protein